MPTVYQGDALWIDYEIPLYAAIDSTWTNWSGKYEVSVSETSTPLLTGSLTRSTTAGIFNLRLSTGNTTWTALTTGTYKLMVEFNNSTVGYREEKHTKLIVQTQGLT